MHGLGNDFVLVDALEHPFEPEPELARWIADRRRGIGCDQILIVEPGQRHPAAYRIVNADGSLAQQCGNGVRCIARYLRDRGVIGDQGVLESPAGNVWVELAGDAVRVDLGQPILNPERIPFDGPVAPALAQAHGDDGDFSFMVLSMGNPHAVIEVADVDTAPVVEWGPLLQSDRRFNEGVNVGFMAVRSPGEIALRVYERGAGETLACGSGACAAVVSGRLRGRLGSRVRVELPGGTLVIEWEGVGSPITMTGAAEYAFEGTFET